MKRSALLLSVAACAACGSNPMMPGTASAMITPDQGGTLRSADGRLTIAFPAGAVASSTMVSVRALAASEVSPNAVPSGVGYELKPDGLMFPPTAMPTETFTLSLTEAWGAAGPPPKLPLTGLPPLPSLALYAQNVAGMSEQFPGSIVKLGSDDQTLTITASTPHFSEHHVESPPAQITFVPDYFKLPVGTSAEGIIGFFPATAPILAGPPLIFLPAVDQTPAEFVKGTVMDAMIGRSLHDPIMLPDQSSVPLGSVRVSCKKAGFEEMFIVAAANKENVYRGVRVLCEDPAPPAGCSDSTLGDWLKENALLGGSGANEQFCPVATPFTGVPTHSNGMPQVNPNDFTASGGYGGYVNFKLMGQPTFVDPAYPCGQGQLGFTVCPPGASTTMYPDGPMIVVANVLSGPIPIADPANHYQFGFVFDQDGIASNNYVPSGQFPSDFFKDSDLWYEADYAPGAGWTLKVTDARNNMLKQVPSNARIILQSNAVVLAVPANELAVKRPSYRVTTFRHKGDYGIPPPYDWNGSIQPPVSMGLQAFPLPPANPPNVQPHGLYTQGSVSCAPLGYFCDGANPCCNGTCGSNGLCQPPSGPVMCTGYMSGGCCWPTGYQCDQANPCCAGSCSTNGICLPPTSTDCPGGAGCCWPNGSPCDANTRCCTGTCNAGVCG